MLSPRLVELMEIYQVDELAATLRFKLELKKKMLEELDSITPARKTQLKNEMYKYAYELEKYLVDTYKEEHESGK